MTRQSLMIPNGDFSGGWYNFDGEDELTVAEFWAPWWQQGTQPGELHRPEFKPETARFEHGQKLFTTFSTHRGGIFQRVLVSANTRDFELFVDCQYWSEHTDGTGGGLGMRVGLDPTGGTDPYSAAIRWGDWHGQDDPDGWDGSTTKTLPAALDLVPSQWVTIWLESRCRYPAKWNDAYFANVQAWFESEEPPGPIPPSDWVDVLREISTTLSGISTILGEIRDILDAEL